MDDDEGVNSPPKAFPTGTTIIWSGFGLAIIAAILVLAPGPAYRIDLWSLDTAFTMMRWGAYCGAAAAAVAVLGIIVVLGWRGVAIIGALAIGGIMFLVPWVWRNQAQSVPPIHDITTNTTYPPTFDAVLAKRQDAPNSPIYGGAEVAAQQHQAYPDIQPLRLDAPPAAVFKAAVAVVKQNGWTLQAANPATHKIEATATTFWFGFKDDVAIRIRPQSGGSVVDIRSASRIGKSDVGTNAKRVRHFMQQLKSRVTQ